MKKIIIFILAGVLLIGCTAEDEESTDKQTTTTNNSEQETNRIPSKNKEVKEKTSTRPPDLSLDAGNILIPSENYSYCWDKSDCSIKPKDPKETMSLQKIFPVQSGQRMQFVTSATENYVGALVPPDTIEVTQISNKDEKKVSISNNEYIAPEEKGRYYLNVYAKWNKEIQGEAYYAFSISVR
ncbi:hypothetical protein [Virgibacillus sp. Bac330]|uniref:hypothetical protein n=1 Tax=Virgibacillus sp. Bac330 TaxID=2419841 RepID=UPI000EF4CBB8|nr:hypothetical protein [Virgibacillus sp. Bac330]